MLHKSEARHQILSQRKSRTKADFHSFEHKISEYAEDIMALLETHFSLSADKLDCLSVAAYLPQNHEPGSRKLLRNLGEHGINVYCPVIPPTDTVATEKSVTKVLHWSLYQGTERPGPWNIPEPDSGNITHNVIFHAMIIPALSIDAHGNRLGRGGGFYDQTLIHCTMSQTILLGMCFTAELVRQNPTLAWKSDPWDIPVHYTISESEGLRAIAEHKNHDS